MGTELEKLVSIDPAAEKLQCAEGGEGDDVGVREGGLGQDAARSSSWEEDCTWVRKPGFISSSFEGPRSQGVSVFLHLAKHCCTATTCQLL